MPENLVPGSKKKRRTEMPPHDGWAAKKVPGLEVAAVDRSLMTISSLTPQDDRSVEAYVAGPAALLVAKAYKLNERVIDAEKGKPHRLSAKDAGDVYRIMATVRASQVAASFDTLCKDSRVGAVAAEGLHLLRQLFGAAATPGTELAVQALAGDIPARRIRALVPSFVSPLASVANTHLSNSARTVRLAPPGAGESPAPGSASDQWPRRDPAVVRAPLTAVVAAGVWCGGWWDSARVLRAVPEVWPSVIL
ncbi:hypothetical protein ACFU8Q_16170 [Streptomyces sp. NPDC057543]|uniref:hypothetical protein n=1 Tax=Streptomyces sp. NPDC057543 TaxID=3346163 RepID=UPI0036BA2C7A